MIDYQIQYPDFVQQLHEQTSSYALDLQEKEKANLLEALPKLLKSSNRGALRVRQFNHIFLETFIPWSEFARSDKSKATTETKLDQQIFISFNADGSVTMRNHGYRRHISQKIESILKTRNNSPLRLFRGTHSAEMIFIKLMGAWARKEFCKGCHEELLRFIKQNKIAVVEPISDEQLLKVSFDLLYKTRPYLFTTPDYKWAAHWGQVYQIEIPFLELPQDYRDTIYVAIDAAHNLLSVVEIDFPVRTFEEAVLLFSKSTIQMIKTLSGRTEITGEEIKLGDDLRDAITPSMNVKL